MCEMGVRVNCRHRSIASGLKEKIGVHAVCNGKFRGYRVLHFIVLSFPVLGYREWSFQARSRASVSGLALGPIS
jgi:hypothetical protein